MSADRTPSRRAFCFMAGGAAAIAAPIAAAMAAQEQPSGENELLSRLEAFEDEQAIRALHQRLVRHLNGGSRDWTDRTLFARAARMDLDKDVSRLDVDTDDDALSFDRAPDGKSARLQAGCSVTSEEMMQGECMMVRMALAQGEGMLRQTRRQQLESSYVKVDGRWLVLGASLRSI